MGFELSSKVGDAPSSDSDYEWEPEVSAHAMISSYAILESVGSVKAFR